MKTRNSTKSKLLSSVIALVLCVSMLIGATFAWFTDTASTGVNKIQAGNLDVQLLDATTGESLEGKTLKWTRATETGTELADSNDILWEPGCTYKLQPITIKNNGDLKLKYKIVITGIQGDAKLNEAIEWTITNSSNVAALGEDHPLEPDAYDTLTIQGHMKEEAGNEYQGLSIDGIGITVYATQKDAENDSFDNTYDQNAGYIERHATIMGDDGKTITLEQGKTYTVGNATVDVAANGDITYTNTDAAQTVTIQTDGGNLTVNAPGDTIYHYGTADSVTINAIKGNSFHEFGEVAVLSIAQGRVVVENGDNIGVIQVKPSDAAATNPVVIAVPENVVLDTKIERTNATTAFKLDVLNSNGTAIEEKSKEVNNATIPAAPSRELEKVLGTGGIANGVKNYVAINGDTYYDSLQDAVDAGGTVKLVNNVSLHETVVVDCVSKTVTINMNGYNITGDRVRAIQVKQGTLKLDGTGTVSSTVKDVGSSVIRVGDNNATAFARLDVNKGVTVSTETAYGITAFGADTERVNVYGTVTSTAPENAAYDGCAISTVGDDTTKSSIYVYDGATVSAANTNAIYMPSGDLTVKGGTITGRTGIYVKSGTTTIQGGTITGTGPAVEYTYYGNGGISTGDALVVDSCGYPKGKPHVTVIGGTFTSVNAKAVASYNKEGNALVTGFVRGGTFSSKPVEEYLFDGRLVATNTNGTFTVEVVAVAQIGEVNYGTLYEAVSACKSGETIKLLRDVTLDKAYVTYGGWANCATGTLKGTLDGNNHTITLGEDIFFGSYFGTIFGNPCLKNVNIVANNGTVYVQAYRGTFENVKVSGSIEVGNNTGAFVIYGSPYSGALTFKNCEMAATMYGGGTANNYNAAFVGYGMGSGAKFNFEDCKMTGSLTCGVAAVFLGNDSQLGENWKVNISNFTFGENAAVRNTLTSGYSWKFNGIVAANNAPGTPVVTIDDTPYSGKDGFTQLIDAKNTIWDAKHFAYGPLDASLKLTKNEDGTFTITPAESEGAVKYVVSMAVYTTATAGGSLVQSVSETITDLPQSGNITTTLKDLKFIDQTWVDNNSNAVKGTLAGNTIYTLDRVSYYMIGDNVHGTLNGNPKSAQIYGVTAYDANGNIVASAPLTK